MDGTSGISKTPYNGYYGDFGYFCKDQSRGNVPVVLVTPIRPQIATFSKKCDFLRDIVS